MEEILPKEKRGTCVACADSPVSHHHTLILSSMDAFMNDTLQRIPLFSKLFNAAHRLAQYLESPLLQCIHFLCGGKVLKDPDNAPTNRATVLWKEAERRGLQMEQIVLWGKATDYYRVHLNGRWFYFEGLPIPRLGNTRSYTWMDDKYLFKRFLERHNIPAARAILASSLAKAREQFKQFSSPVVIKPRMGSRARHTTTEVRNLKDFETAFTSARELCHYVIVEEHLEGKLCRVTLVGGRVVGFLKKSYPSVIGDGVKTLQELIAERNAAKPDRVWDIILDEENLAFLKRKNLIPESVVPTQVTVELSARSGRQVGGDTREMPEEIHPKLREQLESIARELLLPVIAFDLIIPDPEKDPDTQKWGLLEANTLPFIDLHYNPLYGTTSNVAGALWDLWETKSPASAGLKRAL